MFDALKKLLVAPGGAQFDPEAERRRLRIATCALLLEAAHADDVLDAAETRTLIDVVSRRFQLSAADATQLLAVAEVQRRDSTDLYGFAREINAHFTREQKLAIVELLWRIVYSDGRLEAREDALMHRVAYLLELRQQELIALKLQVKNELGGASPPAS